MRLAALAVISMFGAPTAGPVVSGDAAVWAEANGAGQTIVSGPPRRTVRSFPDRAGPQRALALSSMVLDGTPDGAFFAATGWEGSEHQLCAGECFSITDIDVGILSASGVRPVPVTRRCGVASAEVGDAVTAVGQDGCSPAPASVVTVRGPAGEQVIANADTAQAAGPYAGWIERGREQAAVVFDATAGREVARFAGADLVDLQADGKVLLRTADGGAAWSSAQDPKVRRLPVQIGPAGTRARLDGDRILVARRTAPRGLDLVGLDGSRRTVVDLRGREFLTADFDLVGDHLAWARATCAGAQIRVQHVDDPVRLESRRRCSTQLSGPARVVSPVADEVVARVPVRCGEGTRAPCGAVRVTTASPVRLGGRRAIRAVVGGYTDPGEFEQSSEDRRLTAAGRRLLSRTGRLRVRVVMAGARPVVTTLRASPGALRLLRRPAR